MLFPSYFSVSKKRNIKRSPNGIKPSGTLFLELKQSRELGVQSRELGVQSREAWSTTLISFVSMMKCAQVVEEELRRMLGMKYVNDEHDCNIVSMNSLNTHDANDMQSHKHGDSMFDEHDMCFAWSIIFFACCFILIC